MLEIIIGIIAVIAGGAAFALGFEFAMDIRTDFRDAPPELFASLTIFFGCFVALCCLA